MPWMKRTEAETADEFLPSAPDPGSSRKEKYMNETVYQNDNSLNEGASALLGRGQEGEVRLLYSMANRHGLIAGATGTGKTVSLKVLAENFSSAGVPVLITDIKSDISSIAEPGTMNEKIAERLRASQVDPASFAMQGYPVRFFDVFGRQGIPLRALVSDLGPMLLSRLLDLSEAQQGVLNIVFKAADDRGWELTDLKDLKSMIRWCADHKKELEDEYGAVSPQSAATLQRKLLELENQNGTELFGLPAFDVRDLFERQGGLGLITLIECSELYMQPLLYSAVILWLLSELYEQLPEAGDLDRPRVAVFIDEAHLLFDDAPKVLRDRMEQMIRLIRSKGCAVFLVSQSPSDIPDAILAQLSNRIQHALRAYTPAELKKAKAAAAGFRQNPNLNTLEALQALRTGEALVSVLDEDGAPIAVERILMMPPHSSFEALGREKIQKISEADPAFIKYGTPVDPKTAYEILEELEEQEEAALQAEQLEKARLKEREKEEKELARQREKAQKAAAREAERQAREYERQRTQSQSAAAKSAKKAMRSAARSVGRSTGEAITRGLMKTSSSSAKRAASRAAGSLLSDLFGSFFR